MVIPIVPGPWGWWLGWIMAIPLRRVITLMLVIVVPGRGSWIIEDDIGSEAVIKIGGQDPGTYPIIIGIVMIITQAVVIIDADGGVIPIPLIISVITVVGAVWLQHAAPQPQGGDGQNQAIKPFTDHGACFLKD